MGRGSQCIWQIRGLLLGRPWLAWDEIAFRGMSGWVGFSFVSKLQSQPEGALDNPGQAVDTAEARTQRMPLLPLSPLTHVPPTPLGPPRSEGLVRDLVSREDCWLRSRDEENAEPSPAESSCLWDPISWSPGRMEPTDPREHNLVSPPEDHMQPRVNPLPKLPEDSIYTTGHGNG